MYNQWRLELSIFRIPPKREYFDPIDFEADSSHDAKKTAIELAENHEIFGPVLSGYEIPINWERLWTVFDRIYHHDDKEYHLQLWHRKPVNSGLRGKYRGLPIVHLDGEELLWCRACQFYVPFTEKAAPGRAGLITMKRDCNYCEYSE